MKPFLLLGLLMFANVAVAQSVADKEIAGLIDALARSGCEFERNGNWYSATRAKAHLSRKYAWLRKRDLADTSEHFIERAASNSSMSGKPYQVRCKGRPTLDSAAWFKAELQRLRRQRMPSGKR
ncbi:MAG: DUF5329 domain-containing protein [Lysobacter sp.]|nr:DUF5329 domain-containing protein [Lysobacter sp.]